MNLLEKIKFIYFLGIGGIGMSALARYFLSLGKVVGGYDRTESALTRQLITEGMNIHYSDDINSIPADYKDIDNTLVVYTPAIPSDSNELNYFRNNGFRIVKRAEVLGLISIGHKTIAVAGSHGKTTISSMISWLFFNSQKGCTAFLGGIAKNFNSNLVLKHAETDNCIITEADEFDRSFLQLSPYSAVITSTDADHLDIYGSVQTMHSAFEDFAKRIVPNGSLVIKNGLPIKISRDDIKIFTYSLDHDSDFYSEITSVQDGLYTFNLHTPFGVFCDLKTGVPGILNVENAIAACAIALIHGIEIQDIRSALTSFSGIIRRFDYQIKTEKIVYIDDYAHHPNEISAVLGSLRQIYQERKIIGIFQPHLFTRTRDFADEFAASLEVLDEIILLPIYPARELPIDGVTSEMIFEKIINPDKIMVDKSGLIQLLEKKEIEILITMGAGDIDGLVLPITNSLKNRL